MQQVAYMQQMPYIQQYQYYAMTQQQPQQQAALSKDQEFEGSIKSVSSTRNHGFIVCSQTWAQYERDVYVDSSLMTPGASRGTRVKFTVELNEKNHPKAKTCKLAA